MTTLFELFAALAGLFGLGAIVTRIDGICEVPPSSTFPTSLPPSFPPSLSDDNDDLMALVSRPYYRLELAETLRVADAIAAGEISIERIADVVIEQEDSLVLSFWVRRAPVQQRGAFSKLQSAAYVLGIYLPVASQMGYQQSAEWMLDNLLSANPFCMGVNRYRLEPAEILSRIKAAQALLNDMEDVDRF